MRTVSRPAHSPVVPRPANQLIGIIAAILSLCNPPSLAFASSVSGAEEQIKVTTVLLIRHAERESSPPDDPPLSEVGRARARGLVHVAGGSGIRAIYTSQYARTQQTAEPLAKHLGLTPVVSPITMDDSNPRKISEQSLRVMTERVYKHAGETILIVGHSNTVPDIIKALGANEAPSVGENSFDDLFVVTVYGKGDAKVVRLKYGTPG